MYLKLNKKTVFKKGQKYDFLLPMGLTEQHGAFLPFGTDTFVTEYLVDKIEKRFKKIVILPMVEYSRSAEHRGFFGTVWLTEETLERVMFDICNSIKAQARNIFIYSFHANGVYIEKFIKKFSFPNVKIINLEESDEDDCRFIEKKILKGDLDGHAGNSEISNMLVIDKKLVTVPTKKIKKFIVANPWETDNLIERCPNGIADNNLDWVVSKKVGQQILDVYEKRLIKNLKGCLDK
ncbi:MAG: creatininase family protein [Patescibacteria group bacterium]